MPKSSEIVKRVKELQNIDLDDVLVGKKTGVGENIKLKIVIELLKLLGFDLVKDMDFELEDPKGRRIHSNLDLSKIDLKTGDRVRYHVLMKDYERGYSVGGEKIEVVEDEKGGSVLRSVCSDGWKEAFKGEKKEE